MVYTLMLVAACAVWMEQPAHPPMIAVPPETALTQPPATAPPQVPATAPPQVPDRPFLPGQEASGPACVDDLDLVSLEKAINRSLQDYENVKHPCFRFGN
ncbi:MAG: hypothetical protein PHN75_20235, partial [Syntrophales bacterium]|nr:hypothetical protein [Syntrophales bacterium]